jgi:hypothetical protein
VLVASDDDDTSDDDARADDKNVGQHAVFFTAACLSHLAS